jgi:hypothetical protein
VLPGRFPGAAGVYPTLKAGLAAGTHRQLRSWEGFFLPLVATAAFVKLFRKVGLSNHFSAKPL